MLRGSSVLSSNYQELTGLLCLMLEILGIGLKRRLDIPEDVYLDVLGK